MRVRSPQATELAAALSGPTATVEAIEPGLLEVHGPSAAEIGELAAASRIVLHELTSVSGSLEQAYLSLTADAVEYHSATEGADPARSRRCRRHDQPGGAAMSTATTPRTEHAHHAAPRPPCGSRRGTCCAPSGSRSGPCARRCWTIGLTIVVLVLLAWAMAASAGVAPGQFAGGEGSASMVYMVLAPGQIFGSLVLVVLAALSVTGEYGTGQVRSTFAAVPSRLPVLWAKGLVVAVVTFATGCRRHGAVAAAGRRDRAGHAARLVGPGDAAHRRRDAALHRDGRPARVRPAVR